MSQNPNSAAYGGLLSGGLAPMPQQQIPQLPNWQLPAMPSTPSHLQPRDVIVRQVRNGFVVIAFGPGGNVPTWYVAADLDGVQDAIKLAFVDDAISAAR